MLLRHLSIPNMIRYHRTNRTHNLTIIKIIIRRSTHNKIRPVTITRRPRSNTTKLRRTLLTQSRRTIRRIRSKYSTRLLLSTIQNIKRRMSTPTNLIRTAHRHINKLSSTQLLKPPNRTLTSTHIRSLKHIHRNRTRRYLIISNTQIRRQPLGTPGRPLMRNLHINLIYNRNSHRLIPIGNRRCISRIRSSISNYRNYLLTAPPL